MRSREVLALLLVASVAFGSGVIYSSNDTNLRKMDGEGSATANIVAAAQASNEGEIGKVKVEIVPGDGDTLVETNPFIQADTQLSATKAKEVAEKYTDTSLENHDVIYTIEMDSQVVGGPSAGTAMTVATIAAIEGKEVREDAVITGTITGSGGIGRVGEIPVKAYTAGKAGVKDFYVPRGQSMKLNYEKVIETERKGFFVYRDVEYRPERLNISSYTQENFNMRTEEVDSIQGAAEKMLK